MRIVVAVGGNALLERGQRPDAVVQQANIVRAIRALAPLAEEHELVVTHAGTIVTPGGDFGGSDDLRPRR